MNSKPEVKKAKSTPMVKQTKTSYYRMLKANPLLQMQNDLSNIPLPSAVTGNRPSLDQRDLQPRKYGKDAALHTASTSRQSNNLAGTQQSRNVMKVQMGFKKPLPPPATKVFEVKRPARISYSSKYRAGNQPKKYENKLEITQSLEDLTQANISIVAPLKSDKQIMGTPLHKKPPQRRSLSAQYYEKKSLKHNVPNNNITQSLEELDQPRTPVVKCIKHVNFKSPLMHHSTPGPTLKDLQARLNNWLKKRGKPISSFHHLQSVGAMSDDENKENIESNYIVTDGSYENLKIKVKDNVEDEQQLEIVKDALGDLHSLINNGYPLDQCEEWLKNIRQKYKNIDETPNYWECRASIEQGHGHITSAVECFKTAVIKGAEVDQIDKYLGQLLEKFSTLNIKTPTKVDMEMQRRHNQEMCSIFKSSIIQFALTERSAKRTKQAPEDQETSFLATPVRRSTRISRTKSRYVSTPGIKICNSLSEVASHTTDFKNNAYIV